MEHGWQQIALSLWSFSPQFILVWLRRVYRILGVTFLFFANWRMTVSVHALLLLKSLLIFLWTFRILCFQFWKENSWRLFDRWGVIMLVMVLRSLEAKIKSGMLQGLDPKSWQWLVPHQRDITVWHPCKFCFFVKYMWEEQRVLICFYVSRTFCCFWSEVSLALNLWKLEKKRILQLWEGEVAEKGKRVIS